MNHMTGVKAAKVAFMAAVTIPTMSKATPRLPRQQRHAGLAIHSVNFFMFEPPSFFSLSNSLTAPCFTAIANAHPPSPRAFPHRSTHVVPFGCPLAVLACVLKSGLHPQGRRPNLEADVCRTTRMGRSPSPAPTGVLFLQGPFPLHFYH